MTIEEAKTEIMQIYGSLSEEKKMALDVLMAQNCDQCEVGNPCLYCEYEFKSQADGEHDGCKDCVYQANPQDAMPCRECKHNYMDKWQKKPHWNHGVCDNCGYDWGKDAPIASVPNFCPNCGSHMEIER